MSDRSLRLVGLATFAISLAACSAQDTPAAPEAATSSATSAAPATPAADTVDAKVPGTPYHATTEIPCGFDGGPTRERCPAGVIRKWGEDGTTLVEINRPDGMKRAIFFRGVEAYGADGAQADGSAGYTFQAVRRGDESAISYGPERYVIPDALVEGG